MENTKIIRDRTLAAIALIISACCFAASVSAGGRSIVPRTVGMAGQQLEIDQTENNGNELQPPDKVMDAAGVRAGMIIGEVGSGKGRYTVYLARRVGPGGKVYANDIDDKSLAFLTDRCRKQGFANVETGLGTTDDPCFPKGKLDIVEDKEEL